MPISETVLPLSSVFTSLADESVKYVPLGTVSFANSVSGVLTVRMSGVMLKVPMLPVGGFVGGLVEELSSLHP